MSSDTDEQRSRRLKVKTKNCGNQKINKDLILKNRSLTGSRK